MIKKKTGVSFLFFLLISLSQVQGQVFDLSGSVFDDEGEPLFGVAVVLTHKSDSLFRKGVVTDKYGRFLFPNLTGGNYLLRVSYLGFEDHNRDILLKESINLGKIVLKERATELGEITVVERQLKVQQKGDTTEYNAGAFKVNPDANADDLVQKMPGITKEGGTVKAQGEEVKEVQIDGQTFFGEDAQLALKNIPAEIIDKVQVFDKQNDQAQFTGMDDGNTTKTINIVTKSGKSNGSFGNVYAGYGTSGRYQAGGNVNFFAGKRRISVIGMSNNINQQNFSTEDLLGVVGSNNPRRGGRGRGGGGGNIYDFMLAQQGGITSTNALGINYSEKWGEKLELTGSYFFNHTANTTSSEVLRDYFNSGDTNMLYSENTFSESKNINHRINARLTYTINEKNSIIYRPRLSFQSNNAFSAMTGEYRRAEFYTISRTENDYNANSSGYNFGNNLLWRHKFEKDRRTLSLNVRLDMNQNEGNSSLFATNTFEQADTSVINQESNNAGNGYSISPNLSYTEPIGKTGMLQLSYNPSYQRSFADKRTHHYSPPVQDYTLLDSALSNTYENLYRSQKAGVAYRFRGARLSGNVGVDYQYATLSGDQTYPFAGEVDKTFENLLPSAMIRFTLKDSSQMRLFYRANTNVPSINRLQSVINNSNPLALTTGNPDLKQEYSQILVLRYNKTNVKKATNFFAYAYGGFTRNYIANSTIIARTDSVQAEGILLPEGAQLTKPVNLFGYRYFRSLFTYGRPLNVRKFKSNLNIHWGLNWNRTPGLINGEENIVNTYTANAGVVLSSNISENLDFTLSYNANYNIVQNSLQPRADNNYFSHVAGIRFNYITKNNWVFRTDLTLTQYSGLNDFNQAFTLWNAGFGKKFLKDNRGELQLSVFDLLRQNNSISRTINETYVEDSQTRVLQQFFMLTFTYRIRHFVSGKNSIDK